jgi:hypothetical protein
VHTTRGTSELLFFNLSPKFAFTEIRTQTSPRDSLAPLFLDPRVVLLWVARATSVQPAQLHPPPPVFTPAIAGAARRKSGEQRGGRRRDCYFTHFPLFFHPLHSSLFPEVVGDLIHVGKAGSTGWLAGSGRLVAIRRSSLLLAWACSLAAAAAVVAAAVPTRSCGRGWPAALAPMRAAGPPWRRRGLPGVGGVGRRRICSCQRRLL